MTITDFIGGGWKKEIGKTPEEKKENNETERIMVLCVVCFGLKKVGIIGDEDITVPCPKCCKGFYEDKDEDNDE